jgi:hypothetical protein
MSANFLIIAVEDVYHEEKIRWNENIKFFYIHLFIYMWRLPEIELGDSINWLNLKLANENERIMLWIILDWIFLREMPGSNVIKIIWVSNVLDLKKKLGKKSASDVARVIGIWDKIENWRPFRWDFFIKYCGFRCECSCRPPLLS